MTLQVTAYRAGHVCTWTVPPCFGASHTPRTRHCFLLKGRSDVWLPGSTTATLERVQTGPLHPVPLHLAPCWQHGPQWLPPEARLAPARSLLPLPGACVSASPGAGKKEASLDLEKELVSSLSGTQWLRCNYFGTKIRLTISGHTACGVSFFLSPSQKTTTRKLFSKQWGSLQSRTSENQRKWRLKPPGPGSRGATRAGLP